MKHLFVCLCLGLLFTIRVKAGGPLLSPFGKVSILTCDPGTEPYAIFGHSAIRVCDSLAGVDIVFNYGTFNFDDPRFYTKFLRGRLDYYLSADPFLDFLQEYKEDHKRVREQVLNMTGHERQLLYERLLENLKEQNRYYKYDFFYDNCSTRIRNDIEWVYGNRRQADDSAGSAANRNASFRQEIRPYFVYNPWVGFGIDICLGLSVDGRPSAYERMFLPGNLFEELEHSSIDPEGPAADTTAARRDRLVSATMVYDFNNKPNGGPAFNWNTPVTFFWTLFAIGILVTIGEIKYKRRLAVFDIFLFILTGLVGFVLLYLWFFTDYTVARFNLSLFWACPLNLFAILVPRFRRVYFPVYSILLSCLLLFFLIAPNYFDPAILPLVLIMLIRAVAISRRTPRQILKYSPLWLRS